MKQLLLFLIVVYMAFSYPMVLDRYVRHEEELTPLRGLPSSEVCGSTHRGFQAGSQEPSRPPGSEATGPRLFTSIYLLIASNVPSGLNSNWSRTEASSRDNMSSPATHPNMLNKELSSGKKQRKKVYYRAWHAVGRGKVSTQPISKVHS
jgi:hypothetical protein